MTTGLPLTKSSSWRFLGLADMNSEGRVRKPVVAAFAIQVALTKRSRNALGSFRTSSLHCLPWRQGCKFSPLVTRRTSSRPMMTSGNPLMRTAPSKEDGLSPSGVIPDGAFTVSLTVRMRSGITVADAKAVLSEYARKTCAERSVLRCDILYEVTPRGTAKSDCFEIWTSFRDSDAYLAHEKTSHAAKLRLWLENPSGGDNAVMLTKLSYRSILMEPLWPSVSRWRSSLDYEVEDEDERNQRTADSSLNLLRTKGPNTPESSPSSDSVRRSLDVLISNVGLENVTILIATASATSGDAVASLTGICEEYVEIQAQLSSVVRSGVLVDRQNPLNLFIMTVHDSKSEDGAFFDVDLATDVIDESGWCVRRYFSVFPDKVGWEMRLEPKLAIAASAEESFLGPIEDGSGVITQNTEMAPAEAKYRLVQGSAAFDRMKSIVREVTGIATGVVKVMLVSGWNTSRLAPLLVQLHPEEDKGEIESEDRPPNEGTGDINWKFGLSVRSCDASTSHLKEGLHFVRDYQPDAIIGYGGGTVLDMAKALGRLGNTTETQADRCIAAIDKAARDGSGKVTFMVPPNPIPVILQPGIVGSASEFGDLCVIAGELGGNKRRRLCVDFVCPPGTDRYPSERTIISDSRLISPRRVDGKNTAQGALVLVCRGLETLLSLHEYAGHPAVDFAERGLSEAAETVLLAYREPRKSSGQSRDPLLHAQTMVGLGSDCAMRLGLCTRLALAVVDALLDGRGPRSFRMAMVRVTAAVMAELAEWRDEEAARFMNRVVEVYKVNSASGVAGRLLARAEDVEVYMLGELGMMRRFVPEVAASVAGAWRGEACSRLEERLLDEEVLRRVLNRAMDQEYEL